MKIPFMNLLRQHQSLQPDLNKIINDVIEQSAFIGGPLKEKFEQEFASFCGAKYCVGVGNGTDSLYIALKTLNIGRNDEVITAANSFIASSEAITNTGAKPVFVDCDPKTYTIDLNKLESTIKKSNKIKAIIPVHLYGQICPMPEIMILAKKYNLRVIEDSAQAHGANSNGKCAGTFGDFGSFSFYPGKNLGALGDGGALITDNEELAKRARMFANHGRIAKYDHEFEGINSRLDTLQAAVLSLKLKHLSNWTRRRITLAQEYQTYLGDVQDQIILPEATTSGQHVYHLYVIRSNHRNEIQRSLELKGIASVVHYPSALPNLPAYRYLEHKPSDFSVASEYQGQILSLPLYPEMTDAEVEYTLDSIKSILRK